MQNFKKIYQAEVPQISIPKFFLDRDDDDEYRRSKLRKTLENNTTILVIYLLKTFFLVLFVFFTLVRACKQYTYSSHAN